MFKFLSNREKGVLFIFPALMIAVIIFLWTEVNYFRGQTLLEREYKQRWQNQYLTLNNQLEKFLEKQTALMTAVEEIRQNQAINKQDLNYALEQNKTWRDQPLPPDVMRLFNNNSR